jgi:hypothetical protein
MPKLGLRLLFQRKITTTVIDAKVMIVPGGQDWAFGAQSSEESAVFEQPILFPHERDASATLVRINIVAKKQKKIARQSERPIEHRMLVRVEAGAKENVLQRFLSRRAAQGQKAQE